MDNFVKDFKEPKISNLVVAVLSIIFLFFVAKTIISFKEISFVGNGVPAMNTISVTGKGEIVTKPDTATFSFVVTEDSETMSDASQKVSEKVSAVTDAVKNLGVAEEDIKTVSYTSYPKYKYDNMYCYGCERQSTNPIVGFTVSEQTEIKIKNPENVSLVAEILATNKVTNMYGPDYSVYDEDSVREEARALAIQDAREEATKIAKDLGVRLGRVVSFSDDNMYPYIYAEDASYSMMASGKSADAPSISPGTNTITENVTITFEIK